MKCAACLTLQPFRASNGEREFSLSASSSVGKEREQRDNIAYLKEKRGERKEREREEENVQRLVSRIYWWVDDSGTISSIALHRRVVFDILSRLRLCSAVCLFSTVHMHTAGATETLEIIKRGSKIIFFFDSDIFLSSDTFVLLFVFGQLFDKL